MRLGFSNRPTGANSRWHRSPDTRSPPSAASATPPGSGTRWRRCGYRVVAEREFADHFAYGPAEVESLGQWVDRLDVEAAVCTGKDLVKIADRWPAKTPLMALSSRLEILTGRTELEAALRPLAERARQRLP